MPTLPELDDTTALRHSGKGITDYVSFCDATEGCQRPLYALMSPKTHNYRAELEKGHSSLKTLVSAVYGHF